MTKIINIFCMEQKNSNDNSLIVNSHVLTINLLDFWKSALKKQKHIYPFGIQKDNIFFWINCLYFYLIFVCLNIILYYIITNLMIS